MKARILCIAVVLCLFTSRVGLKAQDKGKGPDFKTAFAVETTPLEPDAKESKFYAPGVGLIKDGPCRLISHGTAKK